MTDEYIEIKAKASVPFCSCASLTGEHGLGSNRHSAGERISRRIISEL